MIENTQDAIEQLREYHETDAELYEAIENEDMLDTINELADSNVDIYNYELWKWAGEDLGKHAERALDEFGWDGCGKQLTKVLQMGQYLLNREILAEAVEDIKQSDNYQDWSDNQ